MRAPLRVALGGGGTDLPAYYREHGGMVVSSAIDRYVHMTVSERPQRRLPAQAPRVGGGRRPGRRAPPDPARGAGASLERRPGRAGLPRRGRARHRFGLVGRLRRLRDRGACRPVGTRARARGAGRGRVSPGDRAAGPLGGQAGPVRVGVRRRALVLVRARRHRRGARAPPPRPHARRAARATSCSSRRAASGRPRTCSERARTRRRCTASASSRARPAARSRPVTWTGSTSCWPSIGRPSGGGRRGR